MIQHYKTTLFLKRRKVSQLILYYNRDYNQRVKFKVNLISQKRDFFLQFYPKIIQINTTS